ncbi:MAG: pyridoxal phosphate-dependent aminotransferase [Thermoplasmata archaeon]
MKKGISADSSMLRGEPPLEYLRKANMLEAQGRDMVRFEIGQPDFDTPENIKKAAKDALDRGFTHYVPTDGIPELKEAIQDDIEETRGFRPENDQILVLPGAKPGLYFSMMALAERGDEIIYQNPYFFTYDSQVGYIGCKKVQIPLYEENEFRMDPEDMCRRVTDKTKMIIINSPQNPTGGVLTKKDVEAIAEIAEENNTYILSDEIYSKMLYDGEKHHSPAYLDQCKERTIIVDGFSKAYSMTGWRLGYMIAPTQVIKEVELLVADALSCTSSFSQWGAVEALRNGQKFVDHIMKHFTERRDAIVKGLNEVPGMSCIYPKGAFYAFPNIKETGMTSKELADYMMDKANVCLLPGTAFGNQGEGYLRISYACSLQEIKKGIQRMKDALM